MQTHRFDQCLDESQSIAVRERLQAIKLASIAPTADRMILQKYCAVTAKHLGTEINAYGLYMAMMTAYWTHKRAESVNQAILANLPLIVDEACADVPEFRDTVKEFMKAPSALPYPQRTTH